MLAPAESPLARKKSTLYTLKTVYGEKGVKGLFAGVVPRVIWITIGGGIFFGVYEKTKTLVGWTLIRLKSEECFLQLFVRFGLKCPRKVEIT